MALVGRGALPLNVDKLLLPLLREPLLAILLFLLADDLLLLFELLPLPVKLLLLRGALLGALLLHLLFTNRFLLLSLQFQLLLLRLLLLTLLFVHLFLLLLGLLLLLLLRAFFLLPLLLLLLFFRILRARGHGHPNQHHHAE